MGSMDKELKKLLVVEDDLGLQKQLKWCFEGYDVHIAGDRTSAIAALRRHEPRVITLDLGLPPDETNASEGFAALEEILSLMPGTKVIVVTGNDEKENAVKAIGMGAYDFYQKPIDADVLKIIVDRAHDLSELEESYRRLSQDYASSPLEGLITNSEDMIKVCRKIEKLAPTDATTLLVGESGTGKEILARAVHGLSDRNDGKFVAINCAAIPDTLLESELFGYEKGAFTGASQQTKGKIECADGGTLFLDEIGDLPSAMQAKLLRFLQERTIERLGGRKEIPVDIRIVSATHRNLKEMIASGDFREDLFYRLSEILIQIPPLRDRKGDAVLLARVLFERYRGQSSSTTKGFSEDAIDAIGSYSWPGNVRELENKIKRAAIMSDGPLLTVEDVELEGVEIETLPLNLRAVRELAEKNAITQALSLSENNIVKTAELLGVSRPTLYDLLSKYGLK